jgi:hypothetical protein
MSRWTALVPVLMLVCSCDDDGDLGGDSSVDSAVPMLPAKLALSGPTQEFEAPFGYDGPPVSCEVRNISNEEVIGLAVRLAGLHPQQFRFESKCPERLAIGQTCTVDITRYGCSTTTNRTIEPLAPTGTCTINVQFTPTAAGLRTGTLVLATSNATSVEVPLTGMGFL